MNPTLNPPRGALAGLKVLDLGHAVAGPLCGALLADHGAEVIKLEPPDGDHARSVGPFPKDASAPEYGALFHCFNRNKKSLILDLKTPEGVEAFLRLVDQVDVLIENFRAGVMERLGLGYEVIAARNPRLVYTSIRGFGDPRNGATRYTDWPAVDIVAQAMGGMMGITGPAPDSPTHLGAVPGDTMPGLYAAFATLAAVLEARVSKKGQYVDVGMVDTLIALNEPVTTTYSVTGEVPGPAGSQLQNIVPFGRVQAKDGWAVLAVPPGRNWTTFCEKIDRPELATDARYATPAARTQRAAEVYELVESYTRTRTTEELTGIFGGSIPFAPILSAASIARDPYFQTRQMLVELDYPGSKQKVIVPGVPAKLSRTPGSIRTRAPRLGEHSAEILRSLGYADHDVERLSARSTPPLKDASASRTSERAPTYDVNLRSST
jgi:crotonobetainyl-CoA:carnitine CoA-transferase CaiB-like acyl-CoA transferase